MSDYSGRAKLYVLGANRHFMNHTLLSCPFNQQYWGNFVFIIQFPASVGKAALEALSAGRIHCRQKVIRPS